MSFLCNDGAKLSTGCEDGKSLSEGPDNDVTVLEGMNEDVSVSTGCNDNISHYSDHYSIENECNSEAMTVINECVKLLGGIPNPSKATCYFSSTLQLLVRSSSAEDIGRIRDTVGTADSSDVSVWVKENFPKLVEMLASGNDVQESDIKVAVAY